MGRIEKVNQTIKKEISGIVHQELRDPRLGFVTITHVEVSRDLQHAKVFFSVLGSGTNVEDTQKGLDSAKGYIRRLVGQRVRLRYIPELNFIFDNSVEVGFHMDETFKRLREERDNRAV